MTSIGTLLDELDLEIHLPKTCDRDADVYEYIQYKLSSNQRFIIRAAHNRRLTGVNKLFEVLNAEDILGSYVITIPQKGNRKKREVIVDLRATAVQIPPPKLEGIPQGQAAVARRRGGIVNTP